MSLKNSIPYSMFQLYQYWKFFWNIRMSYHQLCTKTIRKMMTGQELTRMGKLFIEVNCFHPNKIHCNLFYIKMILALWIFYEIKFLSIRCQPLILVWEILPEQTIGHTWIIQICCYRLHQLWYKNIATRKFYNPY